MGAIYTVTGQTPSVYLDNAGTPVQGFRVDFTLHEFDEGGSINVPKLDAQVIDVRIRELLVLRQKLAKLGG